MGQTLTHGVYLPSEGERNCYSGLAANWRLLDGAIGTVAAHTTAIAGKADISHSHGNITNDGKVGTTANLPLITGTGGAVQAGSFGNQANTFCEGNDSRLSDARTPVAHTHGKADVTDLLNSNFIPSANNSYDLGSSSYQWNNLYAKNYFYNGVAWGLDKANVWTDTNTFSITLKQVNSAITKGTNPQSNINAFNVYWGGTGVSSLTNALFTQRGYVYADGSTSYILYTSENVSGGTHTSLSLNYDPNDTINQRCAFMRGDFRPYYDNAFNLGIPTHRWKTLNGINPGALSLPGAYQDITAQIKNPSDQLNAIDLNGGSNTWVSDVDCYLYFYIPNNKFTWIRIFWPASLVRCGQTFVPVPNESSDYSGFLPVPANTTVVIQIKGTKAPVFRRSACLGNV